LRAALLAFAIHFAAAPAFAQTADLQKIEIASKNGTHPFQVEVAANDADRARGLMFRKELPEGTGMLFDFQREQELGFWMKNTYIPLDMIFIRADGTIARIAAETVPHSEESVSSGEPVAAVLEILGGRAAELEIAEGDQVSWPKP
jgi:uncharacterized protein